MASVQRQSFTKPSRPALASRLESAGEKRTARTAGDGCAGTWCSSVASDCTFSVFRLKRRMVPFARPTANTLMRVCGSGGGEGEDSGEETVRARGAAKELEGWDWDWACAAGEASLRSANWRPRLAERGLEALRMRAKMDPKGSSDSGSDVEDVCEGGCAGD